MGSSAYSALRSGRHDAARARELHSVPPCRVCLGRVSGRIGLRSTLIRPRIQATNADDTEQNVRYHLVRQPILTVFGDVHRRPGVFRPARRPRHEVPARTGVAGGDNGPGTRRREPALATYHRPVPAGLRGIPRRGAPGVRRCDVTRAAPRTTRASMWVRTHTSAAGRPSRRWLRVIPLTGPTRPHWPMPCSGVAYGYCGAPDQWSRVRWPALGRPARRRDPSPDVELFLN